MDGVLQKINSQCISFSVEVEKRNNKILKDVLDKFVVELKKDPLFKVLYQRVFYGGSFYDNLKVGQPDEFDLDLLFVLPKSVRFEMLQVGDYPGFVQLKVKNPEILGDIFQRKLTDNGNLSADKLRRWMESLVTKVLSTFPLQNGYYQLSAGGYQMRGKMRKSGPAQTLEITNTQHNIILNVDLVPCFQFDIGLLPTGSKWRKNPVPSKNTFFIVPKRPKNMDKISDYYWRLSFQEQERELMNNKRNFKPALRLMKKLRDVCGHDAIASYYIKTVFLWTIDRNDTSYWNGTLSDVFIKMLKTYIEHLEKGKIEYYWDKNLNLLTISSITLSNFSNRLKCVLKDIERFRTTNPEAICKYFDCKV
nr:cyclic GMP-AMP synthase-like [Onthophagus taurus]